MQELRLVAVSEDGSYAVLVVPGRSGRFALPIDDRLRTVARGQFSRLAQFEIEVESPLRPKEIQDRIRAGETAEEIADAAGLPVDRIRRFEGPVLAERGYRAAEAQRATVRGRNDVGPGPRLGDVVTARLTEAGASVDEAEWDSRKRQDGNWQVQLAYTVAGRMRMAEWVYDPRSKHVTADDDEAARLCLDEADWPAPRPAMAAPRATVTPIGSRAAATAHQDQRTETSRPASRLPARPAQAEVVVAAGHGPLQPATPLQPPPGRVQPERPERVQPERPERVGLASASAQDAPDPRRGPDPQEDRAHPPAAPAADSGPPPRAAKRASGGRSRRSSVPSWDEIMFGSSRQPE